ncbi:hypothetical protein BD410DRAFT_796572 [Rickenella mellea]|uniref:DUF6534 domain-containing protein n=1 Tax=Rickenella mellea TaxID=50990 RepID=A0A4Y7PK69_9AGAM|nr:hypothetical protein BD410DRAFT_796572 [Rickenella mellea]
MSHAKSLQQPSWRRPPLDIMQSPSASDGDTAQFLAFMNNAFWGTVVSTVLFGVSLCQGYFYFTDYDDRLALKVYVTFLLFLDISSTVVWTAGLHKSLILNWGISVSPTSERPYAAAESVITLVLTFLTQLFFAHRVYILGSYRRIIPIIIALFALIGLVGGLTRVIFELTNSFGVIVTRKFKIVNGFENGFAAMSDVVATIAMCIHFVESAMDTRRMTSLLRRLMIYTVNRGILVTLFQTLILALYLSAPLGLNWIPFHMCVGKLYVNTFLAMLNARRRLRSNAGFTNRNESTAKSSTIIINAMVNSADDMTATLDWMPSAAFGNSHSSRHAS